MNLCQMIRSTNLSVKRALDPAGIFQHLWRHNLLLLICYATSGNRLRTRYEIGGAWTSYHVLGYLENQVERKIPWQLAKIFSGKH